ncbi:MAG: HEAT repeat domain-containing protein [Planctomyces sp.]|nr:HEAT repeat domain-containing protein [Planctomyces sp.]
MSRASLGNRRWTHAAVCALSALAVAAVARAEDVQTVELNGRSWTLPPGFQIELVAGPPLVDRPVTADFDEQGRLYVAESSGSNDRVEQQLAERPHRILRLEDVDGDGRFDARTIFADGMMLPEGTLWYDGSLYVAAPPSIWRLTDTNGDGVADHREEWFQGGTLTGCANDLHGPYLGRDGWIYWCKGAFAEQNYARPGRALVTRAAHIFRARPDAPRDPATGGIDSSAIEPVMTGGMDNPVDVVVTPEGERIFTTTFLVHPGGGQRDGLIHAILGGVYGKTHGVLDGHRRTGDVMPVLAHLGPAAPCGLAIIESDRLGADFPRSLLTCCFNMRKVTRHVLRAEAAGLAATTEDFLSSPDVDFHPTDVLEDADGSLLIVDTGGWYKLCCPTSQFWKPDVLGGIYRVRRADAPQPADIWRDPRGLAIDWQAATPATLAAVLDDPRPAVVERSLRQLARTGVDSVPALEAALQAESATRRRNAVWGLTRIADPQARRAVRAALADADSSVRQAALNSISLWRDADAAEVLPNMLEGDSAQTRLAVEAIGRIKDRQLAEAVLAVADQADSRPLEHAVIHALQELGDIDVLERAFVDASWKQQRAAALALDALRSESLDPLRIAGWLEAPQPELRETASWLLARHPEWGDALGTVFEERLLRAAPESVESLTAHLATFAERPVIQNLLARVLEDSASPAAARVAAADAMRRAHPRELSAPWPRAIAAAIGAGDDALLAAALRTAGALPDDAGRSDLDAALRFVADDPARPAPVRLQAFAALSGRPPLAPDLLPVAMQALAHDQPVADRAAALAALARARLSSDQLIALADAFQSVGPLEAARLLDLYAGAADEAVGTALVGALSDSPALAALRVDALERVLAEQTPPIRERGAQLALRINADLVRQRAQLEALLPRLDEGDLRRGFAVFHSTRAACATCHQLGYVGGDVGPDLSRIGKIRTERDLLEAVLFPSASFVRSYEPVIVQLSSGLVETGVLRDESATHIELAKNAQDTLRIDRADIEELRPGAVSIMPSGFGQQLTEQDLLDLVVFLKSLE